VLKKISDFPTVNNISKAKEMSLLVPNKIAESLEKSASGTHRWSSTIVSSNLHLKRGKVQG